MPVAMTYSSLLDDIESWCERHSADFVEKIPTFVMLAENRIASEADGLGYLQAINGVLNGPTLPKPERWRQTKSFSILVGGEMLFLQSRSYQYCRAFWPDSTVTGVPRYYADYTYEQFLIVGTPDENYEMELLYHERPEPLSEANETNWTTQYAPQLLLYASLLEAMPFLKNTGRVAEFQGLYDRALAALASEDAKRRAPDSAGLRNY
jgi:hypothetical protein